MNHSLFDILSFISSAIPIIPGLLAFKRRKELNYEQRQLARLILATILTEMVANFMWYQDVNNLPLFHIYALIAFVLVSQIYKKALHGMVNGMVFNILIPIFVLFGVLNTLFLQGLDQFNSNVTTTASLFYIIFSLIYFYKLLKEIRYESLEKNPMFWLNTGVLLYYSATLFLFFLGNSFLPQEKEIVDVVYGLHAVLNIILNLFYVAALWTKPVK